MGRGTTALPEGAARAVEVGAVGERKGQAVLEPAHVDRRGAPDGARHAHQIAKPVLHPRQIRYSIHGLAGC